MNLALRPAHHDSQLLLAQDIAIALKDFVLIGLLKGEDEALGFAALNWTSLRCLIEIQTLGRVSGRALARGRASTRTDFALVAPFVEEVLRSRTIFAGIGICRTICASLVSCNFLCLLWDETNSKNKQLFRILCVT